MKNLRSAVALSFLLLLLAPRPAVPQTDAQFKSGGRGSFPGCPLCGVWSWVDYPADRATVSAANLVIEGWGFECISGHPAERVEVWYQDYDGRSRQLKKTELLTGPVWRPDVVRFGMTVSCPTVDAYSGWRVRVEGMPPGLRLVTINVWRGAYVETHERIYLVKP